MLKSELNMFTGNRTMVKFLHLKIFIVFSSFPFILGDTKQNRSTAVGIDHGVTDGHNFVKKIVHGDKMSERPGYLVFTAPYKLCEGGCGSDSSDFIMAFPLFIGKKGREVYRSMYPRDFDNIHSKRPNAPFRQQTTKVPFTTCPPVTTTISTTTEAITTEPTTKEAITTSPITSESTTTESSTAKSTTTESATTKSITSKPGTCPEVVPRICRKKKKMPLQSLTQTTTFCPHMFPLLCSAQMATASSEIKKVDDYFSL